MTYDNLPSNWKKVAESMERNYCNTMLEEMEKETGIKQSKCVGLEELVIEQLQVNDYVVKKDRYSGKEYLERIN